MTHVSPDGSTFRSSFLSVTGVEMLTGIVPPSFDYSDDLEYPVPSGRCRVEANIEFVLIDITILVVVVLGILVVGVVFALLITWAIKSSEWREAKLASLTPGKEAAQSP